MKKAPLGSLVPTGPKSSWRVIVEAIESLPMGKVFLDPPQESLRILYLWHSLKLFGELRELERWLHGRSSQDSHRAACNSASRESDPLFSPPWAPTCMCTNPHIGTHMYSHNLEGSLGRLSQVSVSIGGSDQQ